MRATTVRDLFFGSLLLVSAWIPAATLAAPAREPTAASAVEAPAEQPEVRQVESLSCRNAVQAPVTQRT